MYDEPKMYCREQRISIDRRDDHFEWIYFGKIVLEFGVVVTGQIIRIANLLIHRLCLQRRNDEQMARGNFFANFVNGFALWRFVHPRWLTNQFNERTSNIFDHFQGLEVRRSLHLDPIRFFLLDFAPFHRNNVWCTVLRRPCPCCYSRKSRISLFAPVQPWCLGKLDRTARVQHDSNVGNSTIDPWWTAKRNSFVRFAGRSHRWSPTHWSRNRFRWRSPHRSLPKWRCRENKLDEWNR